jgi:hypothetical protein
VLAGCLGDNEGLAAGTDAAGTVSSGGSGSRSGTTADSTPDASGSSADPDLDLREANVIRVEVDRSGSEYGFDVTLYHDDGGESGYANWWQVETLSGEGLGRRELLHAHGSEPFTRSATIEALGEVSRVVVRGHDETHGYGGQTIIVTLASGETRAIQQGSEPRAFGNESDRSGYRRTY